MARKQRHIAQRLRDEYGFDCGYTTVKKYAQEHRRQKREMFVPLSHPPGHAQCDFSEALVVIGGVERKAHYFVPDLPYSDGCFVKAYPAETTEGFLDDHASTFAFLSGVPQSILYDNTRLVVAVPAAVVRATAASWCGYNFGADSRRRRHTTRICPDCRWDSLIPLDSRMGTQLHAQNQQAETQRAA